MKWKAGSWASRNSKVNQMHHLEWKRKRGLLNPLSFFPCKSLFSFLCQLSCLCCSRWFRRPNTLESSQKLWVVMRFTEATNLVIKPFWSHAMPASKNLYFLLLYKKVSVIITQRETKVTWGFLFRCRLRPSKATADFFVVVEVVKKRKTRFTFSDSWLEYICYRVKENRKSFGIWAVVVVVQKEAPSLTSPLLFILSSLFHCLLAFPGEREQKENIKQKRSILLESPILEVPS